MKKPLVVERFVDNGEHSHWELIEHETGELLWTEAPMEGIDKSKVIIVNPLGIKENSEKVFRIKDEEMIELGGNRIISKKNYQKAINEFWQKHKDEKPKIHYEDKVVGTLINMEPMTIELNDYGKQMLGNNDLCYISSRK